MTNSTTEPATGGLRARARWALPVAVVLGLLATDARSAAAQHNEDHGLIRGRVVDETTDRGVDGARVQLLDAAERVRREAVTDETGAFQLAELAPGPFTLRVTRMGYPETNTPEWRVKGRETLTVTVTVNPRAVLLAPLEIVASRRHTSPVLTRFYERMERRNGGTFFSREEIARRAPDRVTDLLASIPGARIESTSYAGATADRVIRFNRSHIGPAGGECPVQVFVDGMLARGGIGARSVSPDELVNPLDLEGVEVYRGMSTLPPEFVTENARCGVVALWTKRGGLN